MANSLHYSLLRKYKKIENQKKKLSFHIVCLTVRHVFLQVCEDVAG